MPPVMSMTTFSYSAVFFYLLASIWLGWRVFRPAAETNTKLPVTIPGSLALLLHVLVLHQRIFLEGGLNFGFFNALSLICWAAALLVVIGTLLRPLENQALVFFPAAAVALLLEQTFNSPHILSDSTTLGLRLHILLSVTSYSLLAIAALQAVILSIQERQLRNKHPVAAMRIFPPMQIMEELLLQFLGLGFFLLSLSLATGLMFVHDIFAQHLAHKTTLSILAWIIFGTVLSGRRLKGWRGQTLIRWTLGGFVALMLAYFGSKLVLELILHRT